MPEERERHFLEAFLDCGEAAIDLATDNEAVEAVPVVGTAFKLLRGIDDFRNRALVAKLQRFLASPELQSDRVRRRLKHGIASSPEEASKIGESLFLVLDQMTDLDKPCLLAKVFLAYLDDVISSVELRRIAHAMDSAFTDDLVLLSDWDASTNPRQAISWMLPLAGSGLTSVVTGQTMDDAGEVYYQLTELGETLHRAFQHAREV
ncbi:hypothetical protein FBR04_06275 [Betaproteobacteria bacterium PRO7]|jgi:hypothetical protein|nr:hypothetical protein [Betaproteobacteria bacterium PRO7]